MQMTFKFDLGDEVRVVDECSSILTRQATWTVYSIHVTRDGILYELVRDSGYVTLFEESLEKA